MVVGSLQLLGLAEEWAMRHMDAELPGMSQLGWQSCFIQIDVKTS